MASKIFKARWFIGLIGAFAVVAFVVSALVVTRLAQRHASRTSSDVAREAGKPLPVRLHTVQEREVTEFLLLSGEIAPASRPDLYGPGDALIKEIYVTDGTLVNAGDVLIELDRTGIELRLASAKEELDSARDRLQLANQSKARKESLRAQELASESEVEAAFQSVSSARLALSDAESEVLRLEQEMEGYTIRAPYQGVVRDIVDRGWRNVNSGMRLVSFEAMDKIFVEADVPEEFLALLQEGAEAEVKILALPGSPGRAVFSAQAPVIDPASRSGKIRLEVKDLSAFPLPGMTVQIRFTLTSTGPAVPRIALFNRVGRDAAIFVVNNGVAHLKELQLGRMSSDWVMISNGVKVGDKVVQSGHLYLRENDVVQEIK